MKHRSTTQNLIHKSNAFNDFERVVICGEKKWEEGMAVVCKPFTTAVVRFFEFDELAKAREWIQEGLTR